MKIIKHRPRRGAAADAQVKMASTPMRPDEPVPATAIPALFATIHFQSDERPDGYTDEDIRALNTLANTPKPRPTE